MATAFEHTSSLEAAFNHLVLPPKLPSRNDADDIDLANDLGNRLQRALAKFSHDKDPDIWATVATSINATVVLNQDQLDSHELFEAFKIIAGGGSNTWLALFITQQNCALLIHPDRLHENIVFEAFQTAAPVKTVLAAKHGLIWEFPHRSVQVPLHFFNDTSFMRNLSQVLAQASYESLDQFAAKASKGGKSIAETRDSADPALVTEMLMSLLEGFGSASTVQSVCKKVRDDVVLGPTEVPWRRSPYWLVLRVALRRMLCDLFDDKCAGLGRVYYKFILCAVLAELLRDSVGQLHPEMTLQLRSKLCRRMAKLKADSEACSPSLRPVYDDLFASFSHEFKDAVKYATDKVSVGWDFFKARVCRRVPTLPRRASEADLNMKMENGGAFLFSQLSPKDNKPSPLASSNSSPVGSVLEVRRFAERYISLHQLAETAGFPIAQFEGQPQDLCSYLSTDIINLLAEVGDAFNNNPLLMSQHILRLFELWMGMDAAATTACPLLKDYHPIFLPDSLDVLCLMTMDEMARLNRVQKYIRHRVDSLKTHETIFDNPRKVSAFPTRFRFETPAGRWISQRAEHIDKYSKDHKEATLSQLGNLTAKYNVLTESIDELSCTCIISPNRKKKPQGCHRCVLSGRRKKLRINVHEEFLPSTDTDENKGHRAAITFELETPKYLAAYRAATWKLYLLGTPIDPDTKSPPKLLLKDTSIPKNFTCDLATGGVTLASRKKSFTQTHYGKMKMPKTPDQVLFPFGAEMSYYDTESGRWADELPRVPWYQHLLGLPPGVPDPYKTPEGVLGTHLYHPSSYKISAMEAMCPPDISSNEFRAFQRVASARGRRWFEILKEMAASNFNLSHDGTNVFLRHLALQAGPAVLDEGTLREAHWVFASEEFCEKLKQQLDSWMDTMTQNWRQADRMETVLTFSLRLYHIGPQSFKGKAHELLLRIRSITSNWILLLQHEVRSLLDGHAANKASTFAFWTALLCRQAYWGCLERAEIDKTMLSDDPSPFFRASIALQESLLGSLDNLPPHLQSLLGQDMSGSFLIRSVVSTWKERHIKVLENAIDETWTDASGLPKRSYGPWRWLKGKNAWWLLSETALRGSMASQEVRYHVLQGHLLVDGKPLGRLPLEIKDDESIRELFEGQQLLTRPSGLLDYQILTEMDGHQVHVGIRDNRVIIKALYRGSVLQLVPRSVFKGTSEWDLPADLVDDCVHWLDLDTGNLEMRRKPLIWRRRIGNWVLDIRNRRATRNNKQGTGTQLVEPNSEIGRRITSIFQDFEDSKRLTIYQPAKGRLSVEMKRLEIRFYVNEGGLLVCPQLRAEVDPQQDIGSLYGLRSRIIVRDIANPDRKSVLVPIGSIHWEIDGIHVAVKILNEGLYARYTVDPVLGRLDCPPEPLLLYLKAAMHALTSFPLPDELTGRTGTEEARHCLLSARSQPWTHLADAPQRILSIIKSLSPKRTLYPPGLKRYQKFHWDNELTSTIQHEDLAPLVEDIQHRSRDLEAFGVNQSSPEKGPYIMSESHLPTRGRIRRQVYERICFDSDSTILSQAAQPKFFVPSRDKEISSRSRLVHQTVRAMLELKTGVSSLPNIAPILEKWNTFESFKEYPSHIDLVATLGVEIPQIWGSLADKFLQQDKLGTYDGHFSLALLAFDDKVHLKLVMWLVALFKNSELLEIDTTHPQSFTNFRYFENPSQDVLESLVLSESVHGYDDEEEDDGQREYEASQVASSIIQNWPTLPLSYEEFELSLEDEEIDTLDLWETWENLDSELQRLSNNWGLSGFVEDIEWVVAEGKEGESIAEKELCQEVWSSSPVEFAIKNPEVPEEAWTGHVRMNDLLSRKTTNELLTAKVDSQGEAQSDSLVEKLKGMAISQAPKVPSFTFNGGSPSQAPNSSAFTFNRSSPSQVPKSPAVKFNGSSPIQDRAAPLFQILEHTTLQAIIQRLVASPVGSKKAYGEDLQVSLDALSRSQKTKKLGYKRLQPSQVEKEVDRCRLLLQNQEVKIKDSVSQSDVTFSWLSDGQLWPCFSPVSILEQLQSRNRVRLTEAVCKTIVDYGILTTRLQRYLRIRDAMLRRDERWLQDNSENEGHTSWSPFEHPEWLLLEIDGNFLIRPVQVEVARAIISPESEASSVLQMNMGQGKTSCIMPMAAIMLADRINLCRLLVPRALLLQTAQVMQSRLGGLVDREVCHIPFARWSPTTPQAIELYRGLHQDIMTSRGVMLCLPEHLLSFKLSGLQKLADGEVKKGHTMMAIQAWLEKSSRDVIDESDLTLSPKTQLIYPSGVPAMIDGHPQRWQVIQEVLSLVESHVPHLQSKFKDGIQVRRRHQGFPIIHILQADMEDHLNDHLVDDICNGRLSYLQFNADAGEDAMKDVRSVLSEANIPPSTWENALASLADEASGGKVLHLLHGLISQRLLILCLKKSWNVQYGLHPNRAPIAVPFEAKGIPSQTAEYGHPDTALVLTCLSFYHAGLNKSQLLQSLQLIGNSEDPPSHYQRFISSGHLPDGLHDWSLLEMDNDAQITKLWQHLRFDKRVVNHFLDNFAFPQHAKQFGLKFQASAWDIPLLLEVSSSRTITTGFSGTNDNKKILPHTIRQDDLPSLLQTNAEVLVHLLEPRNQKCVQAVDRLGQHLNETELLELLRRERINILIDAGAQILEMENHELATAWLNICPEAQGAVYFDRDSRIMVRARFQKSPVPLLASPFAENLSECVVYIDEAHTRGTDLKLPPFAQGAVTLGISSTKDQIVQAAMRLRQLATTQCVSFIAPPEVYQSMLSLRSLHNQNVAASQPLKSPDVVHWLLEKSCETSDNMSSLHIAQGFDFCKRMDALWKFGRTWKTKKDRNHLLNNTQQPEGQTLEQLYGPKQQTFGRLKPFYSRRMQVFVDRLHQINTELYKAKVRAHSSAFDEVEQQREVEFEVHQLRDKQNPTYVEALEFPGLDDNIVRFCVAMEKEVVNLPFGQAFDLLNDSYLGQKCRMKFTSKGLLVSKEFSRTVQNSSAEISGRIMRPVEWILWRPGAGKALIIIPEEAELLIPRLRKIQFPYTYLLTYAAPLTRSLVAVGSLAYYPVPTPKSELAIPSWLSLEVGLLAGRLYLPYDEFRGLSSWIGADPNPELLRRFLAEWMAYRSGSSDITHTPMGYLIRKKVLPESHPFFTGNVKSTTVEEKSPALVEEQFEEEEFQDAQDNDDDIEWIDDEMKFAYRQQI